MILGSVVIMDERLTIEQTSEYREDRSPVIDMFCEDGEPYARVTICVPGTPLERAEALVKMLDENALLRDPLLSCGIFTDTMRRVEGFEVWRFQPQH